MNGYPSPAAFDVTHWLSSIGMGHYAATFVANHIDLNILPQLGDEGLISLGVVDPAQRQFLLQEIHRLTTDTEMPAPPPFTPPPAPEEEKKSGFQKFLIAYRKASGGSLLLSIGLHALIFLIGFVWVVHSFVEDRKISFGGGDPGPKSDVQHKVQMKRKTNQTAPAPTKRITTTSNLATVALPDMPDMPTNMGPSVAGAMGAGGFGAAGGLGGGGGGGGGGKGGGIGRGVSTFSFFGLRSTTGEGMVGTFYDFKMNSDGKNRPDHKRDRGDFIQILQGFKSGSWRRPHFESPEKLSTKFFFFPGIPDTDAGKAFQSPNSGAGYWAAHYKGQFRPPASGKYRFVGWGDNVLAVKVNGDVVLDASDWGVYKEKREPIGAIKKLGKKSGNPVFAGKWIQLDSLRDSTIEVVLSDEGGIFCAGLLIQKEGQTITKNANGIPELPLFIMAPLAPEEKRLLKDLPPASLNGPVFPGKSARTGLGGLGR